MLISTSEAIRSWTFPKMFQSLDWVDVDFDFGVLLVVKQDTIGFNPSTGLMLISTWNWLQYYAVLNLFQSLDWVDVDFDKALVQEIGVKLRFQSLDWVDVDFDPQGTDNYTAIKVLFQSLDWVDVDFDVVPTHKTAAITMFQSLDWVDVDFDQEQLNSHRATVYRFNPSTGLMLISTWRRPWSRPKSPSFNPSTGLVLISTWGHLMPTSHASVPFQSLDWVDVDFDPKTR